MIMIRDAVDPSAISSPPPDVSSRKQDRRPYDGPLLDGGSERGAGISRWDYSELCAGQEFAGQNVDRYPDLKQQVAGLQAENASLRARVTELRVAAADRDRQLSDLAARLDRLESARRDDGAAPDMTGSRASPAVPPGKRNQRGRPWRARAGQVARHTIPVLK